MNRLFKYASLLAAAVMLSACGNDNGEGNEGVSGKRFYMTTDKDVIQSDGTDAASIKVFLGDEDVTSLAIIYDDKDQVVNLDGGLFTATEDGEYKFWAKYGTYISYDKAEDDNGLLTVKAISVPVPEVVADPEASNTSFVHRAFLTQYTGTGCGYCPYMIKVVKELLADNTIPEKAVLAAVHSFGTGDPAYISAPAVKNYPFMHVNFETGYDATTTPSETLYSLVNGCVAQDAAAGISVNPVLYEDGTLVIRVSVKAAADGNYRVGAWLLEDGIFGQQADNDRLKPTVDKNDPDYKEKSYDYHENCLRAVDSKYDGSWCGKHLGAIKAGKTAEKTFVMNVKKAWVVENLHLAVIVSKEGEKGYTVCNAVDVPIDAPTPFEYK